MKMRELEQRTGVRREMIHFYFRNGLLPEPDRPKPNVAVYSDRHVRSIQAIRGLQTERRLSIEEIKQALNGNGSPAHADADTFQHLDQLVAARLGADQTLIPLDSIKDRNPSAEIDAHALQKVGAIELVTRKGRRMLSRVDAQIVLVWGDMRAAGFTEALGFDAQLAAIYVDRARDLAQAEIAAYLSRVTHFPRQKKADWARPGLTLMMNMFTLLRMKAAIEAFREADAQ